MADSLETLTNKVAGLEATVQNIENSLKQIPQLNQATIFDGSEKILIYQNGESKQASTVPASISTSFIIHLNKTEGASHRATGINPLTGALTIDLTGVVEKGWAEVFWTSPDGSWPTVTVTNGTGLGVAGANITAITKTIGSLPSSGNYNIGFDYSNGILSMWSVDASGASSGGDTTAPLVSSFTIADANPDLATIVFNETVTFPDVTGLSMDGDFADITLSNPQGSGDTWTLDLSRDAVSGESGNFVYGATNTIEDASSNPLAAGSTAVTNSVAGFFLDGLATPLFAGGTRNLRNATDDVMEVRDAGDNLVATYNGAEVTNGTLTTAIGANDGYVSKLLNQGGSVAEDFIQPTNAEQPRIVASGALVTLSGKPVIDFFTGTLTRLRHSRVYSDNIWSMHIVFEIKDLATANQSILNQHTGASATGRTSFLETNTANNAKVGFFNNGTSNELNSATDWVEGLNVIALYADGANNYYIRKNNGSIETLLTGQDLTPLSTYMYLGSLGNGNNPFHGTLHEIVLWDVDLRAQDDVIKARALSHYS